MGEQGQERKRRSEELLASEGIPYILHLGAFDDEDTAAARSAAEVANRLRALVHVARKAADPEWRADVHPTPEGILTPGERRFADDPSPPEDDRDAFAWRFEAAWVLYWALRWTDGPLGFPRGTCDARGLADAVGAAPDLAANGLRPLGELLDQADLVLRCHWATRQATLTGQPMPAGLDPGVTMQRHHALEWLANGEDEDWDDVATHT